MDKPKEILAEFYDFNYPRSFGFAIRRLKGLGFVIHKWSKKRPCSVGFLYFYTMIFIAGAQPKIHQFRCTTTKHCFRCNNDIHWILQKQQQFITLVFLPLVPLKTTFFCQCPICGNSEELDKETFEEKVRREAEPYNLK